MKLRSSHLVTGFLVFIGMVLAYAFLRPAMSGPKTKDTDAFLSHVKDIRSSGGGSGVRDGIVPSVDVKNVKTAQLKFEQTKVEMGIVANDRKTQKRLSVRNVGEIPIDVVEVQTSCNCTQGKFERTSVRADGREITTITPGEEIGLIITIDPSIIHGFDAHKQLTITTNDPVNQRYILDVISRVDPEFTMEPDSADFGTVQLGTPAEIRIVVRQVIDRPFNILKVKVPSAPVRDRKNGTRIIPPVDMQLIQRPESQWQKPGHKEWDIVARLSPQAPVGEINPAFLIVTDLKRTPDYALPEFDIEGKIYANIVSFFTVAPDSLGARNVCTPGQTKVAEAKISGDGLISVSDVTITGNDLGIEIQPQANPNEAAIILNVLPNATSGLKNETVEFTVKSGDKTGKHSMRAYVSVQTKAPAAGQG